MPELSGSEDFLVGRSASDSVESFQPSYLWACAIDDGDGGYRLLVRAWDLADTLLQQRAIQAWLCLSEGTAPRFPSVFHTSLLTRDDGHRLEKRTPGVTLDELREAGVGPQEILSRFKAGFDFRLLDQMADVSGETRRELRLSEAGF